MANEEKEKIKKKRIAEYNKIFKELPQEKKKLIRKSIEQAVHMEMQLDELQIQLEKLDLWKNTAMEIINLVKKNRLNLRHITR